MQVVKRTVHYGILLGAALALSTACSSGSSGGGGGGATETSFGGMVAGPAGEVVANATVYLVPTSMIDKTPITPEGVLAGTTTAFDEPLEDLVDAAGATFTRATTDMAGAFMIDDVPDGRFFVYVEPDAADLEHLPGGSLCRASYTADELRGITLDVEMSSSPSAAATYVGMSICLSCHPTLATEESLAHRLGFRVPGVSSPLQNPLPDHPEIDDGLEFFLDAADYTGGTPVYMADYDSTRGFDKFRASLDDPSGMGATIFAILWIWRDTADDTYKITFENVGNPADPSNFAEREVVLTYGGAVYKQRYMIRWPGLNGLYPVLQFQTFGDNDIYERTRNVFRDYHLDFFWDDNGTPSDETDDLLKAPSNTRNIERNCMGCHAPGYTQFTDMVTGEVLCDSVEDPDGEFDIDGDGFTNDLNVSCESCHGPGSEHVAAFGADGRYVVAPEYLTHTRSIQICARCHDRQVGNGTVKNDHPLNANDEWPLPGIRRAEYLADYTTRPGPAAGSFWPDFEHSKSHHQQAPDFFRSAHFNNEYQLLTCASCHNMHGGTGFRHGLREDPDASESQLCMNCHRDDITSTLAHTEAVLGVGHGSFTAKCVDCHMPNTAKTGSGEYGYLLAAPTGTDADGDTTYFENDIASHSFDVIPKGAIGIVGVQPGKAMPAPYTNSCGTCHDPSGLQF